MNKGINLRKNRKNVKMKLITKKKTKKYSKRLSMREEDSL
jgi:hypothetical protein